MKRIFFRFLVMRWFCIHSNVLFSFWARWLSFQGLALRSRVVVILVHFSMGSTSSTSMGCSRCGRPHARLSESMLVHLWNLRHHCSITMNDKWPRKSPLLAKSAKFSTTRLIKLPRRSALEKYFPLVYFSIFMRLYNSCLLSLYINFMATNRVLIYLTKIFLLMF